MKYRDALIARLLLLMVFALGAFGYGIGVGHYQWPPWDVLAASFRAAHFPPGMIKQSYLDARMDLFARSTLRPEIVMLGDSLTEMGIWDELLEGLSVANRGIGGDDSAGVLKRLPEVLSRNPRVICLEIGSNDLQNAVPMERVIENIRAIAVAASQAGSVVILQSVPFVVVGYRPDINDAVKSLNVRLRDLTNGAQIRFFDLNAILADGGALDPRNSFDGEHFNVRGYLLWIAALKPVLRDALQ
jgi:lysophospholipase L1-like esterase